MCFTVGRVQSQPSIKYQDPSLQDVHHTYSQLGVPTNNPSVFYAAASCTYTPWTIAFLLIMTIGLSISWGVAYRYLLPAAIRGWSCLSIPISFTNWFREIFTKANVLSIGQVHEIFCRYLFI